MRIDRCICYKRSFSELKNIADDASATSIKALQRHVEFGRDCKLCHPYIRRMLRTGETSFGRIVTETDEPDQDA